MTMVITVSQVRDGFVTPASDATIAGYIAVVDQADACLTDKSVPDAVGQAAKIAGVRYMCVLGSASSKGKITMEKAVSGSSRSFSDDSGQYLEQLRVIDGSGCVYALLNKNQRIALLSIGRSCPV